MAFENENKFRSQWPLFIIHQIVRYESQDLQWASNSTLKRDTLVLMHKVLNSAGNQIKETTDVIKEQTRYSSSFT